MGDQDSFQDRLRAIADKINHAVERLSELDLEELAGHYGVDAERARGFADAAAKWLATNGPLFNQSRADDSDVTGPRRDDTPPGARGHIPTPGPHPLDLPTHRQGLALSALDSGRWTVRPGSNQLAGSGEGPPPPPDTDLVGELRARDWITSDGALTLVGHRALARWCRRADELTPPKLQPDAPSA